MAPNLAGTFARGQGAATFPRSGDQKPACGDPGANPATNRGGRVRQLIGLGRLPIGGMPPAFRLFRFSSAWLMAPVVSTWPAGPGQRTSGAGQRVRWLEQGGLCAVAREAQNGVDSRSGIQIRKSWSEVRFRSETKPGRRRSAPGPENQIPIPYPLDPKTKFLFLTHADDTGLRESRRQRMLLVLVAAVIAMITSSTASAAPPRATLLLSGLNGWLGQHRRPRWRALRHRKRRRQDLALRSRPVRSRPLPAVCRRRSSASAAPST